MNELIRLRQVVFLVSVVLFFALCGCGVRRAGATRKEGTTASSSGALQSASALVPTTAVGAVSEPMRPFFAAGLGFLVLGGVTVALGGRGTGAVLMGLGGVTTAVGVLFVQYPWVVLPLLLLSGVVAGLAAWDRMRTAGELRRSREALAATAQVIQNLPEGKAIKQGLAKLGKDVEDKVRDVVDPIKRCLREEGKISP